MKLPPKTIKTSFTSAPWFGPLFALVLFTPALLCIVKGGVYRWPYASYGMYGAPWSAEKYANFHRVAVGLKNEKPIWWKPGFEYRVRNVSNLLSYAYRLPEGKKRESVIQDALSYVDNYLRQLHPASAVTTLYIFRREVQPDWTIRDSLIAKKDRRDLTP